MKRALLFACIFLIAAALQAQERPEPPEMETDRPGQTESAKVVPPGYVQVESGFLWEHDKKIYTVENKYLYPVTTIRIGVLKFAELRLQGEYKKETEEITRYDLKYKKAGFARAGLGLKAHLWDSRGALPEAALLAHAILPVGSHDFKPEYIEPDLLLTFANKLTDKLGLVYSVGGHLENHDGPVWEIQPRKYDRILFYTLQLTNNISDQLQGFIEYYGEKQQDQKHLHHLDTGLAWKILPNLQLDILGGIGLTEDAPDFFMETGVSIRLPR